MENKFIPLGDRVLVKSTDSEKKTKSGLVLTESARRGQKVVGEVVAVGLGIFSQAGERIPMTVKVGDKIMYAKDMAGDEIKIGDEKFLLFNEHQLLGIFNG
jgi:chaperonin GroES